MLWLKFVHSNFIRLKITVGKDQNQFVQKFLHKIICIQIHSCRLTEKQAEKFMIRVLVSHVTNSITLQSLRRISRKCQRDLFVHNANASICISTRTICYVKAIWKVGTACRENVELKGGELRDTV